MLYDANRRRQKCIFRNFSSYRVAGLSKLRCRACLAPLSVGDFVSVTSLIVNFFFFSFLCLQDETRSQSHLSSHPALPFSLLVNIRPTLNSNFRYSYGEDRLSSGTYIPTQKSPDYDVFFYSSCKLPAFVTYYLPACSRIWFNPWMSINCSRQLHFVLLRLILKSPGYIELY